MNFDTLVAALHAIPCCAECAGAKPVPRAYASREPFDGTTARVTAWLGCTKCCENVSRFVMAQHAGQALDHTSCDTGDEGCWIARALKERDALRDAARKCIAHAIDEKPPDTAPPRNRLQNIVCILERVLSEDV